MLRFLRHKLPSWQSVPHRLQPSTPHTAAATQPSLYPRTDLQAISFAPEQQHCVQQTPPDLRQSASHIVSCPDLSAQALALFSRADEQAQTAPLHTQLSSSCLNQPAGILSTTAQQQAQAAPLHTHTGHCFNPKADASMQQAWNRSSCKSLHAQAALHSAAAVTQGIGKKSTGPVAVAISGGVDSAVAALLLKQAG